MRIMMKLTAVWLVFGLFFGAGLFGQQRYTLKSPEFRIEVDEDGFHRILVKGYSSYGVAGYPDLPSRLYRIAVPPEAIPASISVSYGVEEMGTPGFLNIAEIPPMTAWVDDRYVYGEKEDVYTQNDFFPRKPLEYAGVSRMRK